LDFGVRLQDAHKTGLGSSAALVTSFTGALLCHYLSDFQFSISSEKGKAVLHNLAQAAHCAAQGKVGSGFDIAAAVYGTCIYRRFSPAILSALGEPTSANFAQELRNLVEDTDKEQNWDTEIKKDGVRIPEGMALVMCDVDCGSETVGMVKKVLEWRKQDPSSAKTIWDQLQRENETLAKRLLSGAPLELKESFLAIRAHIRHMGARSGVPIEPPEQTALLDAVANSVNGVYGGVVPGAGGYDAIVLLVKDDEDITSKLCGFLKEWSSSKGENVKLLDVKGEMEGVRREDDNKYQAWII
jgi:phosphomevalonate kinase